MLESNVFRRILKGKVVIVGIGNILRGDDGLGPVFENRATSSFNGFIFEHRSSKLFQRESFTCFQYETACQQHIAESCMSQYSDALDISERDILELVLDTLSGPNTFSEPEFHTVELSLISCWPVIGSAVRVF